VWTVAAALMLGVAGWLAVDAAIERRDPAPPLSAADQRVLRLLSPLLGLAFLPGWINLVLGQPATLVVFLVALAAWVEARADLTPAFGHPFPKGKGLLPPACRRRSPFPTREGG